MATTVTRTNCDIKVTIRIQFYNESGLPDAQIRRLVNGWVLVARVYLNGPQRKRKWRCCNVTFEIDMVFGPPPRAGYHQIKIVHARNGSHRSGVSGLAGTPPQSLEGEWDDADLATVASHEIGHLIGVDDEYINTPGGSVNTNPKPGEQPQSIMGQTNGAVQFLQEHVNAAMVALGADCPDNQCCPAPVRPPRLPPRRAQEPPIPKEPKKILRWVPGVSPLSQTRAVKPLSKPAALEDLKRGLQSENVVVRSVVTAALSNIYAETENEVAFELLQKALDDDSAFVQLGAAEALLKAIPDRAAPILISLLLSDTGVTGHPPTLVADTANRALTYTFGRATIYDNLESAEERLYAYEDWKRWWRLNQT